MTHELAGKFAYASVCPQVRGARHAAGEHDHVAGREVVGPNRGVAVDADAVGRHDVRRLIDRDEGDVHAAAPQDVCRGERLDRLEPVS